MEFCFLHPQRIKDQKPRRIDERTSKVVKCSLLSNYYHKKQSQWVKSSKSTDSNPNFCKLGLMGFRKNQLTSFHLREQNLPCAFPFLSFAFSWGFVGTFFSSFKGNALFCFPSFGSKGERDHVWYDFPLFLGLSLFISDYGELTMSILLWVLWEWDHKIFGFLCWCNAFWVNAGFKTQPSYHTFSCWY